MPLIYEGDAPVDLKAWFKREQPDAIIVPGDVNGNAVARELGLRIPGAVGFASANKAGASIFAGMEERPSDIGSTAIGLLASMIQRGEKGIPAVPTVTMIKGRWMDGRSLRPEKKKVRGASQVATR